MKMIVFALLLNSFAFAQDGKKEVTVVPTVNLARYAGTWYEIARMPNRFQNQCMGDVTATYSLMDDGRIRVVNRCRNEKGEFEEAEGVARKATSDGPPTKLEVRFAPGFLSFLPFVWGDYWIIDLADDYSYAVIGHPERKYLWILSRTPHMDEATYAALLQRIAAQGYDTGQLVKTKQGEK